MTQTREGNYSINIYDYPPRPDYYSSKDNEDNNYSYKTKNNNKNDPIHGQINKMVNSKEALWKADWYSRRNYEDTHHYYSDGNDDDNLYLGLETGEFGQSILGNYDDSVQSEVIIDTNLINRINHLNQINEINHSHLITQPRLVKEDQIKQSRAPNHRTTNPTQSVKAQSTHTTSAGSCGIKLNVNYINHKLVANHSSSTTKLGTVSHAPSNTKLATNPTSTTAKLVAHHVPTTKASPNHASTTIKLVSDHDAELIFNTNGGVINKKKDQEPTSPEVTCLGRVRIKKRINKHKNPSKTSVTDAASNGSNTTHTSSSDQMDDKSQISQTNLRSRRRIRKRVSKEADDQLSTKMDLCMIKGGLIKEIGANQININDANKSKSRNSANKTDSSSETKSKVGIFSQLYKDKGPGIKGQDHNNITNTKIKAAADEDKNIIASSITKHLGKNRHNSDYSNVRITDQSDADVIIDLSRFGSSNDQIWSESLTNCLINETNLISNKTQMIHGGEIIDSESFFVPPPQNSLQLMRNSRNKSSGPYLSLITTTSTTSLDPSKSKHLHNSIPQSDIMHQNHHSTLAESRPIIGQSNTTPPHLMKISHHEHNLKHQAINNTAHGDHTMISLWQRRRIPQPSAIDLQSK